MAYPTNPIYRFIKDPFINENCSVQIKKGDYQISIPFDPNNIDYQEYLAWVAEGNTAEAAD